MVCLCSRYLLGLCYMHDKQYSEAQAMYRSARDILKANVQAHPEYVSRTWVLATIAIQKNNTYLVFGLVHRMAGDLTAVIKDLAEKIDECRELEQEKARAEQDTKAMLLGAMNDAMAAFAQPEATPADNPFAAAFGTSESSSAAAASAVPVARDLGSLVRKRKAPGIENEEAEAVKKEKVNPEVQE